MMKKVRKVVMEPSPSSSSFPLAAGEDARARSKHQSLLQDYEDLLRETEVKRRQLQITIAKKQRLTAEVKFLRRKYKSFPTNPSQEIQHKLKKKMKKQPHNKAAPPSVRFTQPQNQLFSQPKNQVNNADIPLQDRNQRAKDSNMLSTSRLFDLNQNADEMEEIDAVWEPPKIEKPKRCSVNGDMIADDLNLPIFRDVGGSSSSVGKRKISWQDPVALKV